MKWIIIRITPTLICAWMCIFIGILQQGCGSSEPGVDEELPTIDTSDEEQVPMTEGEQPAEVELPDEVKPPEVDLALLPEANDPNGIWNYLTKENPYTKWSLFPGDRIPEFAKCEADEDYVLAPPKFPSLQGSVAKLYINDIALAAINDEPRDLPNGSIIIYEVHSAVGAPPWGFSGRYKMEGASEKNNDWITFTYQANGSVFDFGPNTRCHGCHIASDNDYVWVDSPLFDAKGKNVPNLGW